MASKSSSPGPNAPVVPAAKQARSRKAATQKQDIETATAGRAGSAGGIVLEREKDSKLKNVPATTKNTSKPAPSENPTDTASNTTTKARRKPRKLNKDPTSTTTNSATATPPIEGEGVVTDATSTTELEALKSRVRGLEAKVEELYKNGSNERSNRSPRRRGKGRKNSSAQQVPTLSTPSAMKPTATKAEDTQDVVGNEEEADEELVRLEDELEVARQDLARYRPRNRRSRSGQTNIDDDVEEIPRDAPGVDNSGATRQVTLSGSYRIPLPASVNTEDLKTIQSGVSAAQNVARSFLEQRRAAAALREQQSAGARSPTSSSSAAQKRPKPAKSVSSSMSVVEGEKQSWSEWFGGYSVAISRAVKSIEHEAAVESQRVATPSGGGDATGKKKKTTGGLKGTAKRPPAKATMSSEQVHGLMS